MRYNPLTPTLLLGALCLVGLPSEAHGQGYGGAVAVADGQIAIGEAQNQTLPGMVYLYAKAGGAWKDAGRLMASESGPPDGFGRALAFEGSTLFVGSPGTPDTQGAVFTYTPDGNGGWAAGPTLIPETGALGDRFGSSLAASGDRLLVGAPGANMGTGTFHAYVRQADGTWMEEATVGPAQPAPGLSFGAVLAVNGDVALVGAPDQRSGPGGVFAFRRSSDGSWRSEGAPNVREASERIGFGSSLAIKDGVAYIGAPRARQALGDVFLFEFDTERSGWVQTGTLSALHGTQRAQFGSTVHFVGDEVWVGAPGHDAGAGAFFRYASDGSGGWSGATRVSSSMLEAGDTFGSNAAFGADVAVVAAAGVDSRAGGAVIMERTAQGWNEVESVVGDHRGYPAITGDEVECSDNQAAGFECNEVNVVAFLPISDLGGSRGTRVNDIWGWTDPETGAEIAIVGRTDGTSFVDVTNPSYPRYLGDLPKTEGSRSSIWRDMKVYRDHVYIVADAANEHGMQVFDLRRLRDLEEPGGTFEADFTYDQIHSAHNIVIDEASGFAYAVGSSSGGTTCGGGLHMISLDNPSRPEFAGCFADPSTGRSGTGYSHDAQCVIYHGPDEDHAGKEICLGSNETALSIADVSDKENPVAISSISYPNVAYTHQGWLSEDHRYFYQNDEGDEPQGLVEGTRTLVWDLVDLDDPVLVTEYIAETTSTDHNLYVIGDLMYQSNYDAGLRVIDISVPTAPVEIAYFDTTPYGGGGSWSNYPYFESGLVIATSMGEGLFILKNTGRRNLIP